MDRVYSLRHLGFFSKHLLTVKHEGFYYKDTLYTRDDVKKIFVSTGVAGPRRMGIHLADGRKIMINAAALELNGMRPKTGFFSGTNDVFEGLRDYFDV